MTVRRNINIESAVTDYRAFREAVESAPEGVFVRAKEIAAFINETFDDMFSSAKSYDLVLDPCDNIFEIEVMVFAMLRRKNVSAATEIASAIGLGRTLLDYPETRERVIAGLARDRDFLRNMRKEEEAA